MTLPDLRRLAKGGLQCVAGSTRSAWRFAALVLRSSAPLVFWSSGPLVCKIRITCTNTASCAQRISVVYIILSIIRRYEHQHHHIVKIIRMSNSIFATSMSNMISIRSATVIIVNVNVSTLRV